ncbi:phage tail tip fiber protein [Atlantibacter hermannii]|uniref:phage tail tip fiber protein n=1 Tax=Atlantibacter hermannii TaxID=565 RepID=UPI0028AE1115|nr:hypothetical protein [Atlantibacter hermannii]
MKNTYQMMKALVTLPPVGETISDNAGNTRKYGGEHKVHIAAVDRSWTAQFSYYFDEPILLRELNIQGFSSTPWVVSEKIMVPDGYLIIAVLVDEKGIPLSNEMLPLELEELPCTGWSLNKSGEAHITGEPDSLQVDAERVGQNFIKDAFIQDGTITNAKIGTAIVSGQLAGKSDDRLMKVANEYDPVSLKTTAYKFQGEPLPFGGFPGPNVISAKHAVGSSDTKSLLSDDMREAVIDAVRNSEVFRSLVAKLNTLSAERESDAVRLQRGIDQALSDTIRNALKPGGLLFNCGR